MGKGRSISQSETVLSEVMMPMYANHYGSVHGGVILRLVDEAAFVAATKHARMNVVVASMDQIIFKHPVSIGDLLSIKASLCYVGRSSMEVKVNIRAEKLKEGAVRDVGSAYLAMVALDQKGAPAKVPPLILRTACEKRQSKEAFERRKKRLHQ